MKLEDLEIHQEVKTEGEKLIQVLQESGVPFYKASRLINMYRIAIFRDIYVERQIQKESEYRGCGYETEAMKQTRRVEKLEKSRQKYSTSNTSKRAYCNGLRDAIRELSNSKSVRFDRLVGRELEEIQKNEEEICEECNVYDGWIEFEDVIKEEE